jgi:hypothetical protein
VGKKPADKAKLRPDVNETAFRVLQEATGEAEKSFPAGQRPDDAKNPEAVARGSTGGQKGGKARSQSLGAGARSSIARRAAQLRWSRRKTEE